MWIYWQKPASYATDCRQNKKNSEVFETSEFLFFEKLRHIPAPDQVIQGPGNGDDNQHTRHDTAKDQEQAVPVTQAVDKHPALRQVDAVAQAPDKVLGRSNGPQGPGQMRFQGFQILKGRFFLLFTHTSSLTPQDIAPVRLYQGLN